MRTQIQRDPRVSVQDMKFYTQDNGLLIEIEIQTEVTDANQLLKVFLDSDKFTASYI